MKQLKKIITIIILVIFSLNLSFADYKKPNPPKELNTQIVTALDSLLDKIYSNKLKFSTSSDYINYLDNVNIALVKIRNTFNNTTLKYILVNYVVDGVNNIKTSVNTEDENDFNQTLNDVEKAIDNTNTGSTNSVDSGGTSNPTNLNLSHTSNNKTFTFSWTKGTGNGESCKLQYNKNGTWENISETIYNCDSNISNQSVTLPGDGWYTGNWNGVQIRIIRTSDSLVLGTFSQNLTCSPASGSSISTPNIDEDCNGNWDNSSKSYTTHSGCPSGQGCFAQTWGYIGDGIKPTGDQGYCIPVVGGNPRVYEYGTWDYVYTYPANQLNMVNNSYCTTTTGCFNRSDSRNNCSYQEQSGTNYF